MARWDPAGMSLPGAFELDSEDLGRGGWGAEFTDPPSTPAAVPLHKIPMREFSPEEMRQRYEQFQEQEQEQERYERTARSYDDMIPTVTDAMYARSLRGSQPYSRDEVCRGYRRL
jgi:hypothetical protein